MIKSCIIGIDLIELSYGPNPIKKRRKFLSPYGLLLNLAQTH